MKFYLLPIFLVILFLGNTIPIFGNGFAQNDSIKIGNTETVKPEKKVHFHIRPSLGLTYGQSNTNGTKVSNLQWLGTVNSDFDYIGSKLDLSSSLFMQYGQSKMHEQPPLKLQDAFIWAITPSLPILHKPAIRLFLETTAETNFGKGTIDNKPTSFLDPLFLYQTLFIGQKHYSKQKENNANWELTYGLGYAFQQTLNKNFEVQQNITGNPNFESGFSGIIEYNFNYPITQSISFVFYGKAVALSRENIFTNLEASRRTILVRSGIFYKKIGLEYNYHLVHDPNLSASNLVDQSLMFTLSF